MAQVVRHTKKRSGWQKWVKRNNDDYGRHNMCNKTEVGGEKCQTVPIIQHVKVQQLKRML